MKILIVEDDRTIGLGLKHTLSDCGYDIVLATNIKESLVHLEHDIFSMFILDLGLPDGDGMDLLRLIRKSNDAPVILLTAKDDARFVNEGFQSGADDYITKPFKSAELIFRIEAIRKRTHVLSLGKCSIHMHDAKVLIENEPILLSVIEYQLLLKLANRKGEVVSRESLIEHVWGSHAFVSENTLSVNMKRLRDKLRGEVLIVAVQGKGYKLEW